MILRRAKCGLACGDGNHKLSWLFAFVHMLRAKAATSQFHKHN